MIGRVILRSDKHRHDAMEMIRLAPDDAVMTLAEARRTQAQNDRLWAMLTDISRQKPGGRVGDPETWKALAMHAAGFSVQFEMGLNGQPFPTGYKSSRLTVKEMTLLIEWLFAYGAEVGIEWSEPHPDWRAA